MNARSSKIAADNAWSSPEFASANTAQLVEPSRAGWQALEREFVDDMRWWTLSDLAACAEPVFPHGLAERLADFLAERA